MASRRCGRRRSIRSAVRTTPRCRRRARSACPPAWISEPTFPTAHHGDCRMNRAWKGLAAFVASVGLGGAMAQQAAPAAAASAPVATEVPPAAAAPALTSQDLGSFFDGLLPYALRRNDIAG